MLNTIKERGLIRYLGRILFILLALTLFDFIFEVSQEVIYRMGIPKYGIEAPAVVTKKYKKQARWLGFEFYTNNDTKSQALVPVLKEIWNSTQIGDSIIIKYSQKEPSIVYLERGDIALRKLIWSLVISILAVSLVVNGLLQSFRKNFHNEPIES